jgi:hypothetical protein
VRSAREKEFLGMLGMYSKIHGRKESAPRAPQEQERDGFTRSFYSSKTLIVPDMSKKKSS